MDKQAIFNRVALHLLTQNRRSSAPVTGSCLYRQDKTSTCKIRCAMGIFIPDEEYNVVFEGMAAGTGMLTFGQNEPDKKKFCDILKKNTGAENMRDFDFLRDLQNIHDSTPIENWSSALIYLTEVHELDPSVVTNFQSPA